MKKTPKPSRRELDQVRPKYRLDCTKAKPNRFAAGMKGSTVAVVLDPDVASVFQTSEAVNALLRSVIAVLPNDIGSAAKSR